MTAGSGCSTSRWCLVLSDDIRALAARLKEPWDAIVGIPRGGLVVAAMLGYELGVRTVGAHGYHYERPAGGGVPVVGRRYTSTRVTAFDSVLVVEDSTVTGTLLGQVAETYRELGALVTTASIYVTEGETFRPDVWLHKVDEVPSGRVLLGLAQAVSRG